MCMGEFSPVDPRCVAYHFCSCPWCGGPCRVKDNQPNPLWASKESQLDHSETCPMYQLWVTQED